MKHKQEQERSIKRVATNINSANRGFKVDVANMEDAGKR